MLLNALLRSEFDPVIRSRGEEYLRLRRIRSIMGHDEGVVAKVSGTSDYDVDIGRTGGEIELYCSCPYFEGTGPCKHLWAVLLFSETKGFLRGDGGPVLSVRRVDRDGVPADEDLDEGFDDGIEDEVDDPSFAVPARRPSSPSAVAPPRPAVRPEWEAALDLASAIPSAPARPLDWPAGRELLYVVDTVESRRVGLTLQLVTRDPGVRGGYLKSRPLNLPRGDVARLPNPVDRRALSILCGARRYGDEGGWAEAWERVPSTLVLREAQSAVLLPELCTEKRCVVRQEQGSEVFDPVSWDDGPPWRLALLCSRDDSGDLLVRGALRRGGDERDLTEPAFLTSEGLLLLDRTFARWTGGRSFGWVAALRRAGHLRVPASGLPRLLDALSAGAVVCDVELPPQVAIVEPEGPPVPHLRLEAKPVYGSGAARVLGKLTFAYGEREVAWDAPGALLRADAARLVRRDGIAEQEAAARLARLGFRSILSPDGRSTSVDVDAERVPDAVRELVSEGWRVEADGRLVRAPGATKVSVTSGVDWFDLEAEVDFGGLSASLPELLVALRARRRWVTLGDGSVGLLPEEWLRRHELLAGAGQAEDGRIRFRRGQVALLDALLSAEPRATIDAAFARTRKALTSFAGAVPSDPPKSFAGQLRPYQRDGLGWLHALRELGFGGCLADDMGLGKTVQVLALLDARRAGRRGPSLVVVPRSLLFNWKEEAARFAPKLSVLDYSGPGRALPDSSRHHLVLTTYGTLKRDVPELKEIDWDYVVLDEAQAVKNASTAAAKAVRLVKARHRLALSGTPVENHLGELWSLLDFLNPGVLGKTSAFSGRAARDPDGETRELLARAVRPFILRRTKEKVARELPPKVEQTVVCEMGTTQRRLYTELRDYYRRTLLEKVDRLGVARSKIHVLEALLRLRQAACHPGLVDGRREEEESAKLEALLPQLRELVEEGHKALVFSQFTSFLALVRRRLERERIAHEYLDGSSRDRGARVARFQSDPACPLFLVSLKAGGLGLNLTAAEYVFILDPWWNPAAEAQAVDRTHRIGQSRTVFAYRLITKETIEERVAELQGSKKRLAESILTEDASLLQTLKREDLELLLS